MEQSKHSDDELLALGKKIVKELQYDDSVDTLGKWMSHYVAELILAVEKSETVEEKEIKKKECFEMILKLWAHRYKVPFIEAPLDDLKPLLKVLDSIKERDQLHWSKNWPAYDTSSNKDSWGDFIRISKQRFETILELVLIVASTKQKTKDKDRWKEDFGTILSEDESGFLERIKFLLLKGEDFLERIKSQSNKVEVITYEKVVEDVKSKVKSEIKVVLAEIDRIDVD